LQHTDKIPLPKKNTTSRTVPKYNGKINQIRIIDNPNTHIYDVSSGSLHQLN
jgi:hypothetical protein